MYKLKITVESKRLANKILSMAKEERDCKRNLKRALKQCSGNRDKVAKLLGMSKRTVIRKLKKFGLSERIKTIEKNKKNRKK